MNQLTGDGPATALAAGRRHAHTENRTLRGYGGFTVMHSFLIFSWYIVCKPAFWARFALYISDYDLNFDANSKMFYILIRRVFGLSSPGPGLHRRLSRSSAAVELFSEPSDARRRLHTVAFSMHMCVPVQQSQTHTRYWVDMGRPT